jgi:hypothetical protein
MKTLFTFIFISAMVTPCFGECTAADMLFQTPDVHGTRIVCVDDGQTWTHIIIHEIGTTGVSLTCAPITIGEKTAVLCL